MSVPSQMRALVLDGIGFEHLRVRTIPVPRPGPRQLLARVDEGAFGRGVLGTFLSRLGRTR